MDSYKGICKTVYQPNGYFQDNCYKIAIQYMSQLEDELSDLFHWQENNHLSKAKPVWSMHIFRIYM